MSSPDGEPEWQEGAGGLLLLAAFYETNLLSQLEEVLPMKRASQLAAKLWKQTKEQGEAVYRVLNERLQALEAQGASEGTYRAERKKLKAEADAQLEPLWQSVYRVQEKSYRESSKHERYCREQRDLLRALEDLAASERVMHELDAPFGSDYDCLQGGTGESGHVGAGPLLSLYLCACHDGLACCPFFACQGVYNAGGRWFRWNYGLSTSVN